MPLDDLVHLIERLRERIQQHGQTLAQNEMLARYAFIDPLLRALGWDTEDPACVRPEYSSQYGRADYALMDTSTPLAVIEAKKLNENMSGNVVAQAINYCLQEGTPYFMITDGQRWAVYETHKPVPIDQKKVLSFDVTQGSASAVVVQALALWRLSFAPKQPVSMGSSKPDPAASPMIVPPQPTLVPVPAPSPVPIPTPSPPSPPSPGPDWVRLTDLHKKPNDGSKSPAQLRLPDETQKDLGSWTALLRAIAQYLSKTGKLDSSNCPVPKGDNSRSRYLVNISPQHSNGTHFQNPERVGETNLWLDAYGNSKTLVDRSRYLITHLGENPDDFMVSF